MKPAFNGIQLTSLYPYCQTLHIILICTFCLQQLLNPHKKQTQNVILLSPSQRKQRIQEKSLILEVYKLCGVENNL